MDFSSTTFVVFLFVAIAIMVIHAYRVGYREGAGYGEDKGWNKGYREGDRNSDEFRRANARLNEENKHLRDIIATVRSAVNENADTGEE